MRILPWFRDALRAPFAPRTDSAFAERLVAHRPFHQAHHYFGDSLQSARLIHNFFGHIPAHYDPDR